MKTLKQKKWFIALLSSLSTIACFSVGFASWGLAGGDVALLSGIINTDDFSYTEKGVSTFSFLSTPSFTSLAGKGFLNSNNEYVTSITLTWGVSFNSTKASTLINSLSQNKIWMSASLTATTSPSVIANFSISSMTNTLGTATTITHDNATTVNNGSSITQDWNVTGVSISNSIVFQISIPLVYSGTISNFPNLTSNKLKLILLPGEYSNE